MLWYERACSYHYMQAFSPFFTTTTNAKAKEVTEKKTSYGTRVLVPEVVLVHLLQTSKSKRNHGVWCERSCSYCLVLDRAKYLEKKKISGTSRCALLCACIGAFDYSSSPTHHD